MNLDDMKAFLAIAAHRSLTKAAESLHVSQSSVSHRLKNLEQELELLLVERGKGVKSIVLTPAGEEFTLVAERWMQLALETQSLKAKNRLSLAIGAVDSVNTYLLPGLYQQIICRQPDLRLHIHTQNSAALYPLLEERTIDVAFVLQERIMKNIEVTPLFAEPMVVIRLAAAEHAAEPLIDPRQLKARDELYHEWFPAYSIWHDKWWDPFQASHIQVSNGPMVLPLLQTPQQWAIVPLSIAQSKAATQEYVIQYLSEPPPERICYKLTHKFAKSRTKEVLALLDELLAELVKQFTYLRK
ncbi:LysR family transcriptional regulator [Azotosporobacter soli]|uniref:LysR family transcriptional regulator n=1 Tax=Azotosporobacter soli TaxID=3055040 RepID=UPI0031FE596B